MCELSERIIFAFNLRTNEKIKYVPYHESYAILKKKVKYDSLGVHVLVLKYMSELGNILEIFEKHLNMMLS